MRGIINHQHKKEVLHGKLGANKGLGEAPKAARGRSMKARPTQSRKGSRGDFVPFRLPLAGSRDSVPCGVWGNAPIVPRATSIANALNKGAGSEASLPVTLRVRRRAPKLLFPQDSVKNLKRRGRKLIFSAPCRVLISPYCFFKYTVIIYPVYPLYRTFVHVLPAESTTTVDPCGTCTSTRADFRAAAAQVHIRPLRMADNACGT